MKDRIQYADTLGQVAPAFELRLGRLIELEISGLDGAVGLIIRDDHAVG